MGKSFFDETEEQRGSLPALTGAVCTIKEIERTKTGEKSKNPGCRMFLVTLTIDEPAQFKGSILKDWIVVGTAEDPLAKRPETWRKTEGGPGRLKRLLTRSGTPLSDEDEEWREAAEGRQIVCPVTAREDDFGISNRPGLYFAVGAEDAPEIGVAPDSPKKGKDGKGKAKGAAAASKRARSTTEATADEDEDPKPAKPAKAEKPAKATKPSKDDDDEPEAEDEDDDE